MDTQNTAHPTTPTITANKTSRPKFARDTTRNPNPANASNGGNG